MDTKRERFEEIRYASPANRDIVERIGRHPLSQRFHDILKEMGDLHDKKQKDYGREKDPFANVRGAEEWGIKPWVGALLRATDKIRRLQKYAQTGTLANEGVRDSFIDLTVYGIIGLVLWETENLSEQDLKDIASLYAALEKAGHAGS